LVCLRECQSCLLGGWWGAYSVLLDALSLPACLAGQLPQLRRLLVGVLHNIPPLGLRLRVCWSLLLSALSFVADTQCSGSVGEACRGMPDGVWLCTRALCTKMCTSAVARPVKRRVQALVLNQGGLVLNQGGHAARPRPLGWSQVWARPLLDSDALLCLC
jgi:hypothetical protein